MSYQKQVFQSGQVLLASQLNAMDDQIAANAESIGNNVSQEQLTQEVETAIANSHEIAFLKLENGSLKNRSASLEDLNKFDWAILDKGYVTLVFDDGSDDLGLAYEIAQEYGLTISCAIPPERLTIPLSGSTMTGTVKDACDAIVASGGEVLVHTLSPLSNEGATEQDFYNYFVQNKIDLEKAGYEINGIITAGSGYSDRSVTLKWVRQYYLYSDSEGKGQGYPQYEKSRYSVYDNTEQSDIDVINTTLDNAVKYKKWIVLAFHKISESSSLGTREASLRELFSNIKSYIDSGKLESVTYHYMYNHFGSSANAEAIKTNAYKIRSNEKSIAANTEAIAAKAENPLYGKTMAATGDSITATVSNREYAGYAKIIAERNLMAYETKAIWGATIARGISETSGCILDTIGQMREDADYVILSGGANDFYALSSGTETLGAVSNGYTSELDETTFCGALESMCAQAIERWPGKKLLYVITHRMLDISNESLEDWVTTMIGILRKWGIPYVDLWHEMPSLMLPGLKDRYTSNGNTVYDGTGDGLHPNEEGYRRYYVPVIEARLKGLG